MFNHFYFLSFYHFTTTVVREGLNSFEPAIQERKGLLEECDKIR